MLDCLAVAAVHEVIGGDKIEVSGVARCGAERAPTVHRILVSRAIRERYRPLLRDQHVMDAP